MEKYELENLIEAVLFASGTPVEAKKLATAADCSVEDIHSAASALSRKYESDRRGIVIKKIENGYQLSTNKIYTESIRKCLNMDKSRPMSQTLLETLAIIAYMQPVTKQQIADIRGADANHAVNRLMEKGMVCEKGRQEAPGRPLLFGTTDEFLRKFGFSSINEMPETMNRIEEAFGSNGDGDEPAIFENLKNLDETEL